MGKASCPACLYTHPNKIKIRRKCVRHLRQLNTNWFESWKSLIFSFCSYRYQVYTGVYITYSKCQNPISQLYTKTSQVCQVGGSNHSAAVTNHRTMCDMLFIDSHLISCSLIGSWANTWSALKMSIALRDCAQTAHGAFGACSRAWMLHWLIRIFCWVNSLMSFMFSEISKSVYL